MGLFEDSECLRFIMPFHYLWAGVADGGAQIGSDWTFKTTQKRIFPTGSCREKQLKADLKACIDGAGVMTDRLRRSSDGHLEAFRKKNLGVSLIPCSSSQSRAPWEI